MQKVIGINLNGNAYQVEEAGYDALVAYLGGADAALKDNPDKAEIVADLEQAIAEKCQRFLSSIKTVVTSTEIERIIQEMGPVDTGATDAADTAKAGEKAATGESQKDERAARRLYQIRDGAMLSGVCNGIAAYLNVDVTVVRIAFVILAVLTKGVFLLVYGILMFVIPYANTSEEHAAAHGQPFTAKELIDQAKRNYAEFATSKEWKRQLRRQRHHWKQQWRHARWRERGRVPGDPEPIGYAITSPILGLIHFALLIVLILAMVPLVSTHALFGYVLPPGMPWWAAALFLVVAFQVVSGLVTAVLRPPIVALGSPHGIWIGQMFSLLWLAFIGFSIWWGYDNVPEVRDAIHRIPDLWTQFVQSLQR